MIDFGIWRKPRRQVAALPYRWSADGRLEVLLVTSRETRRWVIPKGWPVKGLKSWSAAAREAREEAGLVGRIAKRSIGAYHYDKRLKDGAALPCEVQVFPLEVRRRRKNFREKNQREPRWVVPAVAAGLVEEPELSDIILAFAGTLEAEEAPTGAQGADTLPPVQGA